eukprot:826141-Pyramimonas_sp.AAC.1
MADMTPSSNAALESTGQPVPGSGSTAMPGDHAPKVQLDGSGVPSPRYFREGRPDHGREAAGRVRRG